MAPLPLGAAARISSALLSPSLRQRTATPSSFSPSEPRAVPPSVSIPHLRPRQTTAGFVPDTYSAVNSSPSPGAIVGIVLGSVAGFLLLLWTIHICIHFGKPPIIFEGTLASQSGSSIVTSHRRRHSTKSHSSRAKSHRHIRRKSGGHRSETVKIQTSSHLRPIIVDEPHQMPSNPPVIEVHDSRRRSTSRPVVVPVAPSETTTETTATEDIIVVEPPPPVRHHSKRNSGHSQRRRSSGYREVHPEQFAGGNHPVREVRRSRGH